MIKDIKLPESMQLVIACKLTEREKRAKIISAEGEYLAAGKLGEAADIIAEHPIALQLRTMQVLSNISTEQNSTIVFPAQILNTLRDIKDFMGSELEVVEKNKK